MKRLLAYLFIVLGFGLTFSVNSNAKLKVYFCAPLELKAEIPEEYFIDLNPCTAGYTGGKVRSLSQKEFIKTFLNYTSKYSITNYHVKRNFDVFKVYEPYGLDPYLYAYSAVQKGLGLNYKDIIKYSELYSKNTQIAKAEPDQTKDVADKIFYDIAFCHPENSQPRAATITVWANIVGEKTKMKCRNNEAKFEEIYNYKKLSICLGDKITRSGYLKNYFLGQASTYGCFNNSLTVKYDGEKFYSEKQIKVAKAEPSQTQKVATVDIVFCKTLGSVNFAPQEPAYSDRPYCYTYENNPTGVESRLSFDDFINRKKQFDPEKLCVTKELTSVSYFGKLKCSELWYETYNIKFLKEKKNLIYEFEIVGLDKKTKDYIVKTRNKKTQIAKAEPTITPKKKAKVAKAEEPKQEEFKPENKDIDNDAPVIEIAQNITVDSQTYTLKGKVKDKSRLYLEANGRPLKISKKGNFELEGFVVDPDAGDKIKIVAIDQWKNKSEKTINIKVEFKEIAELRSYEKPNPSKIKVKQDKNKIAIIIGIEKYKTLKNIDAPYANRDANAFRAYANRALGIPNKNIKVLIDENATRGETLKALTLWLPQITRGKNKDIYVFFAGHGLASDDGKNLYILPQDGDAALLQYTALSRLEIFDLINRVEPNSVTMFFDTCYSGQTRDERMLVAGLRPIRLVAEEQEVQNNFTIFTASNYDQTSGSIEEVKHGIFSYYLMMGMQGKADSNQDKKITNGELIAYLKQNVSEEAFINNRQQEPMLSGDPDKVLISYR